MMPRCPFKTAAFDILDECKRDCMWLVAVVVNDERRLVCSMVLTGDTDKCLRAPMNWMEVDE